jgi:arylsulfatase A-like enzyme
MNIVFMLIDTLRADHLGCYGYPKPTSPAIDHLASEGTLFESCFAPGIPTTPAHTTLYTGRHPIAHNIVAHGGAADLDKKIPVLPELLQQAGMTTCAVDNLFDIKPWLARGYEFYVNPSHRHRMRLMVGCEEINARAIPWIRSHRTEPFFLFLHYWEPHTPYLPPRRYRRFYDGSDAFDPSIKTLEPMHDTPFWALFGDTWFAKLGPVTDPEYIVSLYDGEIRHVDDGVAAVLETLDREGLADDTLVVLTSDHGEVMVRNGIFFDHHGLYEENIHVPLVMRWPGRIAAGVRRDLMATHLDLAPTLLDAVGAQPAPLMEGGSLLQGAAESAGGPSREEVVCCESTWQSKWALRTRTHKLILAREPDHYGNPRRELYDLVADPGERRQIAEENPDLADAMERRLEEWITHRLAELGRTEDPLRAQGITLGKRWLTPPGGARP